MVPVDGSDLAEAVLPHAVALAERFHATIELVRAYTPSSSLIAASAASSMPGTGPVLDPAPFIAAGRQEADTYLSRLAASLGGKNLTISQRRLDGTAAESIVQAARNDDIDLILMTTHGRGGLGRMVLGSVADFVLRHAPCPVLLVRVDHQGTARARGTST
jgi:nucleotide-binding universal stress UspA family protein